MADYKDIDPPVSKEINGVVWEIIGYYIERGAKKPHSFIGWKQNTVIKGNPVYEEFTPAEVGKIKWQK